MKTQLTTIFTLLFFLMLQPVVVVGQFLDVDEFTPGGAGQFTGQLDKSNVQGFVVAASAGGLSSVGSIQSFLATNIDGDSPQFSFGSSFAPTQELGDRIGYGTVGETLLIQIDFDPPVTGLTFHAANLDGATLDFSPSGLKDNQIQITNSNGNITKLPEAQIEGGIAIPFNGVLDPAGADSGYGSISLSGTFSSLLFDYIDSAGDSGTFTISAATATSLPGDVNCDGFVNLLDVAPFVDALASGEFSQKADINQDGLVDLLDVAPFTDLIVGG